MMVRSSCSQSICLRLRSSSSSPRSAASLTSCSSIAIRKPRYVFAETRRRELIITGVTVLCVAAILGFNLKSARDFVRRRFQKPVPAWWGIYEVGDVAKDSVSVGSLAPLHWTALIVDRGTGDSDEPSVKNGLAPWSRYQIRQVPDGSFVLSRA